MKKKVITLSSVILVLGLSLYLVCRYQEANKDAGIDQTSYSPEHGYGTNDPHLSLNGLLLTAEVVDSENWIVRLTWSNVGTPPL